VESRSYGTFRAIDTFLRRLFSTFAHGWPGAGLLLLRMVIAFALVYQVTVTLPTGHSPQSAVIAVLTAIVAILLLVGVWTPITGTLTAPIELRNIFASADNPWMCVLLGALGISIAMIGPGAWSVDARRYGWKRIDPQDR
jgi:putative oxidoreductase